MLLGAPGGRGMYSRWRPAINVIATARAVALLAALLFPSLPQVARADEEFSPPRRR